uniref:helix-turn-helix domain-containing protein n=1 Tax=Dialister sp. TaxID=1955814 RepID=UPI003FEF943D
MPTPKKTNRTEEDQKVLWEIGDRIEIARKRAEIKNQTILGEMVGASQGVVSDWETGKAEIGVLSLIKLAKALNISLDELVMGAVDKVECNSAQRHTLRDTCEFLFKTIPRELPKTLGATYGLSDEALVSDNSSIPLTNYVFELKSRPFIYVKIPLPIALTVPSSRISMKLPTGFARLNQCGVEITRCTDSLVKLNTSGAAISEEIYRDVLSRVPNIPLNSIITDVPF